MRGGKKRPACSPALGRESMPPKHVVVDRDLRLFTFPKPQLATEHARSVNVTSMMRMNESCYTPCKFQTLSLHGGDTCFTVRRSFDARSCFVSACSFFQIVPPPMSASHRRAAVKSGPPAACIESLGRALTRQPGRALCWNLRSTAGRAGPGHHRGIPSGRAYSSPSPSKRGRRASCG